MKETGLHPPAGRGSLTREAVGFGTALRGYCRVILALLRREEESRRAAPMESILELLEPVILMGAVGFFYWFLGRRDVSPIGGSPLVFYGTGFFALYFFIYLSGRMRGAVSIPQRRFPIEQRLDHIIVHTIIRTIDYAILGILVFGTIYALFTVDALPRHWAPIAQAVVTLIMLGFGWGVLNLIVGKLFKVWRYFFPVFNRCLVFFSGVFYVADFLPPDVRHVLSFNPLLHAIALFRLGFYPSHPTTLLDRPYLAACALFTLGFGLVLERVTRRYEKT
jgi:capsular polysaccharide transport system permease protein